jgi:hypothetical protein
MFCTTVDSLNHLIFTEDHYAFLELESVNKVTPWYECWFSSDSDQEFSGNIFLDGIKYDNIHGNIHYNNSSHTLHYDVFDENYSDLVSLDSTFSFIDAQKTIFSYNSVDIFMI